MIKRKFKQSSGLMRIHSDFIEEVNREWKRNKGEISKVNITKRAAEMMRQGRRKNPKYIVNYWPISKKKVKIY